MTPVVHGLEAEYGDQIEFVYLNIDDPNTRPAQQQYRFRVQPHFILLDSSGAVVEEWVGIVPQTTFRTAFNALVSQ